jgi:hypothetical protein
MQEVVHGDDQVAVLFILFGVGVFDGELLEEDDAGVEGGVVEAGWGGGYLRM